MVGLLLSIIGLLGLADLRMDSRYDSHVHCMQHQRALIDLLGQQFSTRTRQEWARRLGQERCLWAPIQTLDDVIVDPQVQANSYPTPLHHRHKGAYQILSAPLRFQRTPNAPQGPASEVGQHTELTRLDLGYTWEEIAALKEQGAII